MSPTQPGPQPLELVAHAAPLRVFELSVLVACAELAEHVAAGSGGIQDGGDVFVETVSEDQAFAYLRRISSVSNAKLRDVAAPVVDKANAKASDTTSDSRADDIVEPP